MKLEGEIAKLDSSDIHDNTGKQVCGLIYVCVLTMLNYFMHINNLHCHCIVIIDHKLYYIRMYIICCELLVLIHENILYTCA